jgi:hypothetical protein
MPARDLDGVLLLDKPSGISSNAALQTARRLADSADAAARWVGKDALRQLESPAVRRRLASR